MSHETFYEVRKIVAGVAILVHESKHQFSVPLSRLRGRITEGVTLKVQMDNHGTPDWYSAQVDNTRSSGGSIAQTTDRSAEQESETGAGN